MAVLKLLVQFPLEGLPMIFRGFPGGSVGKESACNAGMQVRSWGQEDLLEKGMATHSSILAWEIPWIEETSEL